MGKVLSVILGTYVLHNFIKLMYTVRPSCTPELTCDPEVDRIESGVTSCSRVVPFRCRNT